MNRFFGIFALFLSAFSAVRCEDGLINFVRTRLHVGSCRAACIEKFLPQNEFQNGSDLGCRTNENWKCYMCWDYCDMLLEDEEKLDQMCGDNICMEGCQYSCRFYKDVKVGQWNRGNSQIKDVKLVNSSILTWTYETLGEVFAIFGSDQDDKWYELRQSAENQIPIYENSLRNVTIFSISAHGLISQVGYNFLDEQSDGEDYVIFDRIIRKSEKLVQCAEENIGYYLVFALSFVCSFVVVVLSVFVLLFLLKSTRSKRLVKRTIHRSIFYIEVDMDRPNAFLSEV